MTNVGRPALNCTNAEEFQRYLYPACVLFTAFLLSAVAEKGSTISWHLPLCIDGSETYVIIALLMYGTM